MTRGDGCVQLLSVSSDFVATLLALSDYAFLIGMLIALIAAFFFFRIK